MLLHTSYKTLSLKEENRTLIVQIVSGLRANTFSLDVINELTQLALQLEDESAYAAIVLTGKGSTFSGGMDLNNPIVTNPKAHSITFLREQSKLGARMCKAWESVAPLTIAAIEGACVGAGVALSLSLDFRVCATGALIYVPEIERGMNMSWQSTPRSVVLIGAAKTKRMFLLAEKLSGSTAFDWGWADYCVDNGLSLQHAIQLSKKAATMPQLAMTMAKQAINNSANALNHAVSFMDVDQFVLAQHSDDYQESINAFLDKREPNYTGK